MSKNEKDGQEPSFPADDSWGDIDDSWGEADDLEIAQAPEECKASDEPSVPAIEAQTATAPEIPPFVGPAPASDGTPRDKKITAEYLKEPTSCEQPSPEIFLRETAPRLTALTDEPLADDEVGADEQTLPGPEGWDTLSEPAPPEPSPALSDALSDALEPRVHVSSSIDAPAPAPPTSPAPSPLQPEATAEISPSADAADDAPAESSQASILVFAVLSLLALASIGAVVYIALF